MHDNVQVTLQAHLRVFNKDLYTQDNTHLPVAYGVLDHRMVRYKAFYCARNMCSGLILKSLKSIAGE